jgi:hypothetical protein
MKTEDERGDTITEVQTRKQEVKGESRGRRWSTELERWGKRGVGGSEARARY